MESANTARLTGEAFRALASSMPDAIGAEHVQHPDYRIGGKVFATRGYPDDRFAMVKLSPEEQSVAIAAEPNVFRAASGALGARRQHARQAPSGTRDVVAQRATDVLRCGAGQSFVSGLSAQRPFVSVHAPVRARSPEP